MIFLSRASACAKQASSRAGVQIFDPTPSPMERRAGRYRAQLLVTGTKEKIFHQFLSEWLAAVESLTEANRVRWSVDIDPQEMF
jgi:primosomal protein N' (replication factor Y)